MRILTINPGATSTKFGVFEDENCIMHASISHRYEEICQYKDEMSQFDYRKNLVLKTLEEYHIPLKFDAVAGRGGLVKPIDSGVYELNDKVIEDTKHPRYHHVCNLGALIALEIA